MTLVLLNPHARGGRAVRLHAALADELAHLETPTQLVMPPGVREALQHIRAQPPGARIVVVGGDGTLHHLLPALLEGAHELGLVPAGSGDDSARALGLRGLRWREALHRAIAAPAATVDVAEVTTEHETRPFFSSLGVGFDAAVAQRALHGPRWLAGLLRYLVATLQEVTQLRLSAMRVALDGHLVHEGEALFASTLNTASYGGGMPAAPMARIDDGQLDLLLAGRFGRLGTLWMLPRLLLGRHLGHAEVQCLPFAELRIEAEQALPLAADGEAMRDARHIAVRVQPRALRVVRGPDH